MFISALNVLSYVDDTTTLPVRDAEGTLLFMADSERICELAEARQVCGNLRGAKLRYLELIVPLGEAVAPRREIDPSASINARTNIGAYRQHLDGASVWALCLSRAFDGASA